VVWDRWRGRYSVRTARDEGGAVIVTYDLYGDASGAQIEHEDRHRTNVPATDAMKAVSSVRDGWRRDAILTGVAFMLEEPGVTLEYGGMRVEDDDAEYDELTITFDPRDTARAGLVVHAYVDTDYVIRRVDIEVRGRRFGYQLGGYQDIGGLRIATERKNVGIDEVMKLSDISIVRE
jgi:hypothetical protein